MIGDLVMYQCSDDEVKLNPVPDDVETDLRSTLALTKRPGRVCSPLRTDGRTHITVSGCVGLFCSQVAHSSPPRVPTAGSAAHSPNHNVLIALFLWPSSAAKAQ